MIMFDQFDYVVVIGGGSFKHLSGLLGQVVEEPWQNNYGDVFYTIMILDTRIYVPEQFLALATPEQFHEFEDKLYM